MPRVLQPEGMQIPKWQVSRKLDGLHPQFCLDIRDLILLSFYIILPHPKIFHWNLVEYL